MRRPCAPHSLPAEAPSLGAGVVPDSWPALQPVPGAGGTGRGLGGGRVCSCLLRPASGFRGLRVTLLHLPTLSKGSAVPTCLLEQGLSEGP